MTRLSPRKLIGLAVAGAALLASVLIAASLVGGTESGPAAQPPAAPAAAAPEQDSLLRGIPQDGIALGDPKAPVTLVEYADLQCPYCAAWARDAFPAIVDEYVRTGKVRIVFRGLAFVGPDSETALRAALAAGEQGALWNLVHGLFASQGAENAGWVTDGLLRSLGNGAAIDADRMLEQTYSPVGRARARRGAGGCGAGRRSRDAVLPGRTDRRCAQVAARPGARRARRSEPSSTDC